MGARPKLLNPKPDTLNPTLNQRPRQVLVKDESASVSLSGHGMGLQEGSVPSKKPQGLGVRVVPPK